MPETEKTPLVSKAAVRKYRSIQSSSRNKQKGSLMRSRTTAVNKIQYRKPKTFNSFDDDSSSTKSVPIKESTIRELAYESWKESAHKVFENWADMGQKPTLRQRLAFYLDTSNVGRYWDLLDFTIGLLFASIYIWNTQYAFPDDEKQEIPPLFHFTGLFLGLLLLLQWLPRLYVSSDILEELAKPFSLLTLISTIPPIVILACDYFITSIDLTKTYMLSGGFAYLYPFRFMRLHYSLVKLLIPVKNSFFNLSMLAKKTIQLCSTILATILFTTSIIHITTIKELKPEDSTSDIPTFFDVFFFTAVSSTSGFSSKIAAKNVITRLVILYIMVAGALFLPGKISELLSILNKRSIYDKPFEAESNEQHILVVGDFDFNSLFEFLREFFCEDHGLQTMNSTIVILNPKEPSEEIIGILNDPAYHSRVQYVKGTPTSFRSLTKAQVSRAKACFVLTDKFSKSDDHDSDAISVMLALAIKRFNKNIKLYAQVSLPENKPHFNQLARQVICVQELRFGMTAQNLLNPGFSTLLYLLSTSLTETTCTELSLSLKLKPELSWLKEYIDGASHEIYSINFAKCFIGMKFIDVAEMIYRYFGITLFAIGLSSQKSSSTCKRKIYLNPHSYKIVGTETGFIMSSSAYDANRISKLGEKGAPFDEHSCLYSEDINYYFEGGKNTTKSTPKSTPKSAEITPEAVKSDSPIQASVPLERTETKASTTESMDKVKKNLVLDSGDNSEDETKKEVANNTADPFFNLGTPFDNDISSEITEVGNLSVQERNIAQVVSEMMKENSYFDDLGAINHLSGHVVVCDNSDVFPKSMDYFVGTLRGPHLSQQIPVVILSKAAPNPRQRYVLEQFGDVYFIQGSALSRKILFSAGISRAKKAVVLCDDKASATSNPRTADASSLLIVLNIESMALDPDFFVVVEFIHRENMKFVGAGETIPASETYAQALLRPSFMAGHVNSPCMMEPVICQTYYDDFIIDVLDRLIFDPYLDSWRKVQDDSVATPSVNGKVEDIPITHVFTLELPEIFIDRPYYHLVSWLMKFKNCVPLGLYRTRIHRNRQISYAIPNPSSQLVLMEKDKIYIIAEQKPTI